MLSFYPLEIKLHRAKKEHIETKRGGRKRREQSLLSKFNKSTSIPDQLEEGRKKKEKKNFSFFSIASAVCCLTNEINDTGESA